MGAGAAPTCISGTAADETDDDDTPTFYDAAKVRRIVDAAKGRALQVGEPVLAAAVEEIWLESLEDQHLNDLLVAILTKTAMATQTLEFQEYVRKAKGAFGKCITVEPLSSCDTDASQRQVKAASKMSVNQPPDQ